MITITLPDGSKREFGKPVTVADVASSIGAGLAKAAVAGKINGTLVDTFYPIDEDVTLAIITDKDEEGLEIIRHSTAHLLAHAVKELFPETQITIGPVIENGFYYDFSRGDSFTEDDLEKIEAHMAEIAKRDHAVSRREIARDEAIDFFRKQGEEYKATIIEDLPKDETLTLYQQGDFVDLCRGPHVPSTGRLKAFKLTKLAGAYWRGDSNNEMLQRVYGTAWPDKKALNAYLDRLEEAKKRDHRMIAKKMDLYHLQPEAPGMVFWHPNGWTLYRVLQDYMREKNLAYGYEEVRTPIMADRSLWEKSGHWDKFRDEMFITESEKRLYAIKPMNCPCHVQIYNQGLKSYKDLPVRLSEFGSCHRNEPSGTLHGLMRVRNMVQDDGHIFCMLDQIASETHAFIKQLQDVYTDFGFEHIIVRLATRPDQRVGSDEVWSKAEHALESVLNESGLEWDFNPGEGAFYGPKLEFHLKDCLERVWQCGTIQLDFSMPERLEARYVAETGSKETPVMLHRAIFGSFERFLGILIEHYAGHFPIWLAPVQAVILNITDNQQAYCQETAETLKNLGIRVTLDLRNEKIGYKIREHTIARVPYIIVIGDKELEANQIAVRTQQGVDLGAMSLSALTARMEDEIAKKGRMESGE